MSQDNTITVRGYVTAEPKMWQRTPEQAPVATIRVGSTPRKLNRETGEWQDGETSYYSVKCWRKLAENVHGSLRKGDMVIVRGKVYLFARSSLNDPAATRSRSRSRRLGRARPGVRLVALQQGSAHAAQRRRGLAEQGSDSPGYGAGPGPARRGSVRGGPVQRGPVPRGSVRRGRVVQRRRTGTRCRRRTTRRSPRSASDLR